MIQVHQILPVLAFGDAIGNLAFEQRRLLREWGYASEIFAEHWDSRFAGECYPYQEYRRFSCADNLLILHYSTGGAVNRYVQNLPDRVVIQYHNITPPQFVYWANGALANQLREAQQELQSLTGKFPAICDSPYNQEELERLGFRVLGVVPPIFSFAHLDCREALPERKDTVDWLYVGRITPNKCIQDTIRAFYYYHTWIMPRSRLLVVGSKDGMQPYFDDLGKLVEKLGLKEVVIFTGRVDSPVKFFRMADLYVSMSEHEGFCIPLVEAMYCDVPVLAYAATAVPSTLGNAGVLIHEKVPSVIAEVAHEMVMNETWRTRLIRSQRARLTVFAPEVVHEQFRKCIQFVLS